MILVVAVLLAACTEASPPPPPPVASVPAAPAAAAMPTRFDDLSTDDAVVRAYNAATGSRCTEARHCVCIGRPEGLGPVVVVGSFAFDRGCRAAGLFWSGTWSGSAAEVTAPALGELGWAGLAPGDRAALAERWTSEVLGRFDGSTPTRTTSATTADGGVDVTVEASVSSSGRTAQDAARPPTVRTTVVRFGPAGALR